MRSKKCRFSIQTIYIWTIATISGTAMSASGAELLYVIAAGEVTA
jgi:hypothetical protein